MVNPKDFREKIWEILSQEYKIEFLGTDFEETVKKISETKAEQIYHWVKQVVEGNVAPIMKNIRDKKYKGIPLNKLLSFRKEIQISGNEHRILLIKIKNENYIEFHLSQHKYYDTLRKDLSLTTKDG